MSTKDSKEIVVSREELHAFVVRSLVKVGAVQSHAQTLADLLVAADYRGHFSHGLNRVEFYMKDYQQKTVEAGDRQPVVVKQTAATALVDGCNLMGPVVGKFCMDLAIQKAKEAGIGWVSVRGSNHFGIAGWYTIRAADQGLLGMAFTNTSPQLVPTRARQKTLGTNPISVAAPANNGDSMVVDMATTGVALGKVEIKRTLKQDTPLGWGVDSRGKLTTDTETILQEGGLMPLGGAEETSGYKGYGLGLIVEVFCGLLSGAAYGPNIRHWTGHQSAANLGQCFVAVDPAAFAPGFTDRMSDLLDHCRGLEPAEGETEVLVPGDPERQHMAACDRKGGIGYQPRQIEWADDLAQRHGIQPLKRLA